MRKRESENAPPSAGWIARRWPGLATALLVLVTAIAFSPSLRGPQIFDDRYEIQDNATIRHLWPLGEVLTPPPNTAVSGRPLVNLSLALNYWLNDRLGIDQRPDPNGPDKTVSYHAVDILLHLACGLLLLGIVRRTLRYGRVDERWRSRGDIVALLVAALWMLHPLQTDAVDYLSQRTEEMVSLCYLATLYCSIRAWTTESGTASRLSPRAWLIAGVVACLAGMASKEVMISAPIMVVLYDRAFRFTSWRELASASNRHRWFYAALATTWFLLGILVAGNPRGGSAGFHSGVTWYEYLHTQGWAIAHYLRLAVLPTALTISYDIHPVAAWRGVPGLVLLTALGVVTIAAWMRADRWGWLGFLGAWFFLILAPSSSVVPIVTESIAERRMYLPLAAVIIVLLVVADAALRRLRGSRSSGRGIGPIVVAGGVLLALAGCTYSRSRLFADPEALWREAIARNPANSRAWSNLGVVLSTSPSAGPDEAESSYRRAVALDSSYVDAMVNLAMSELGHRELPAAEQHLRRLLVLDSTNLFGVGGLGTLLLDRGDTVAALPYLERFAAAGAGAPGFIRLGVAYLAVGRVANGADAFRQAVAQDPLNTGLLVYVGNVLIEHDHPELAERYLKEAVTREPGAPLNAALLGLAHARLSRPEDAVAEERDAVGRAGRDERVYVVAGRAMIAAGRPDLAANYLGQAIALVPADTAAIRLLGDAKSAATANGNTRARH